MKREWRGRLRGGVGWVAVSEEERDEIKKKGAQNNWHEMNCRQSQRFAEHKTVSGGWFIVAGRTRALLCMHIVYVLMEMWPLLRNIPQTWNDNNTQSGGKKWLGLANWNLWLSLHFISIKSFSFFAVITPHSRSNPWITLCLFSPAAIRLSPPPPRMFQSPPPILYPATLAVHLSSHLGPKSKWLPASFAGSRVYTWGHCWLGVRGVLCNQIDLCRAHQTDEPGRSTPGLNSMHDTLICHALACTCPPAKTLSWLPSRLAPYSLSSLEGKTQAQNGCHCHCTVLWISEDGCALMSRRKKALKSALYVPEELKNIFIRRTVTSDPSCKWLLSV